MSTNRPLWRLSGLRGGYYEPARRMGLGMPPPMAVLLPDWLLAPGLVAYDAPSGWQSKVVALTAAETAAFLSRHPDIKQKVDLFTAEVAISGYFQGVSRYAIPEWGIAVADALFNHVIVFPDASGLLRFTGNVPSTIATQVNLPRYVSPPGTEPLPPWLTAAMWVVGGLVAVTALNTVKR